MAVVRGTNAGFLSARPSGDPTGTSDIFDDACVAIKDTSPSTAIRVTEIGV